MVRNLYLKVLSGLTGLVLAVNGAPALAEGEVEAVITDGTQIEMQVPQEDVSSENEVIVEERPLTEEEYKKEIKYMLDTYHSFQEYNEERYDVALQFYYDLLNIKNISDDKRKALVEIYESNPYIMLIVFNIYAVNLGGHNSDYYDNPEELHVLNISHDPKHRGLIDRLNKEVGLAIGELDKDGNCDGVHFQKLIKYIERLKEYHDGNKDLPDDDSEYPLVDGVNLIDIAYCVCAPLSRKLDTMPDTIGEKYNAFLVAMYTPELDGLTHLIIQQTFAEYGLVDVAAVDMKTGGK